MDDIKITAKETPQGMVMQKDEPVVNDAPAYLPIKGYLGEESKDPDNKQSEQLTEVWEYLNREAKSDVVAEKLFILRSLETKLGTPSVGQSRLNKVHSYIKSLKAVEEAQKWANSHLR